MMCRMSRLLPILAFAAGVSCGSVQPAAPSNKPIASASAVDPQKQAAELNAKGVGGATGVASAVTYEEQKGLLYEVHTITTNSAKPGSTAILMRYFLASDQWMLVQSRTNSDGTRTFRFRRLVRTGASKPKPTTPVKQ